MKRVLITRYGAYGDCLILTPVVREFKKRGWHVTMNTSERGIEVFAHNPNIDNILVNQTDVVPQDRLHDFWDWLQKEHKADKFINYTESIEVALAVHPKDLDSYNLPKDKLRERCNKNYYEHSMNMTDFKTDNYIPELFFEKDEAKHVKGYLDFKKFNLLWGLIGSGMNKFYPWSIKIIDELYKQFPNMNVVTVGDTKCQHIEDAIQAPITKLSGKITMRESMALTKYVDLVVAPDTGLLHASGCYNTPKIGLLGHTTIENITKHFKNDYSIEAQCSCAPCFSMIYDYKSQCPVDSETGAAKCMGEGFYPSVVIDRIKQVYNKSRKNRR